MSVSATVTVTVSVVGVHSGDAVERIKEISVCMFDGSLLYSQVTHGSRCSTVMVQDSFSFYSSLFFFRICFDISSSPLIVHARSEVQK